MLHKNVFQSLYLSLPLSFCLSDERTFAAFSISCADLVPRQITLNPCLSNEYLLDAVLERDFLRPWKLKMRERVTRISGAQSARSL